MPLYCPRYIRTWVPNFMRVSRMLLLLLLGPVTFFVFMALILDGYFEELPRYLYCYPDKSSQSPFNHTTNTTVLRKCSNLTMSECSCSLTISKYVAGHGENEIKTILPPGKLRNVTLGFVPGSAVTVSGDDQVPWIGVIAVGIGFLISLVLNIRYWVEFMNRTINLDGVKVVHCMSLFTVGPGARLLHLLLVYLTFAAVALRPGMKWTVRLLPALLSAVYLGLGQLNLLFSLSHGPEMIAFMAMVPIAAVSIFMETQIAVAMSHLEGGLDQQWQISLTPMWILGLLMFLACTITVVVVACALKDDPDNVPRGGDIIAYGVFGASASTAIACTLIMACHNENTWDRVRQKGHYSWLAVMVPLMLLVGGYLVMQVVDVVGDCIVRVVRWHLGLRNKARMYRKQAIERDNHLAGSSGIDERSDNDVAVVIGAPTSPRSGLLGSATPSAYGGLDGYGSARNADTRNIQHFVSHIETSRNPQMVLIALSSLRNHLTKHPNERTNALKKEILELCRVKQEDGNWSKHNAAVLREILSLFTQLGAVLEQSHNASVRVVEELDKPQPPMTTSGH